MSSTLPARLGKLTASARVAWAARRVRRSSAFDAPWYRAAYPDSAGWDAATHFLAIGLRKGYRPHALFDADWWQDRRGGRCKRHPFIDYLQAPERWRLSPSPYLVLEPGLDPNALPHDASPLGLFRESGGTRGLVPSPLFDADFYARNNPDVVAAGFDPLLHFAANGGREGRSPCVSFDAFRYLSANPDVKARGEEPLRHFLMRGARQGRAPHRAIDPALLLADAQEANLIEALVHYQSEGRHRLGARTHARLPPPGAVAPLFDDWPWRNAKAASAQGRLLVLLAGPPDAAMMATLTAACKSGADPWFVSLDPASDAVLETLAAPTLTLGQAASVILPALLRAAALAGPHLSLVIAAPPEHLVHALAARQSGLDVIRFAHPPVAATAPATVLSISVVVPLYNHVTFIDQRLASILSQRRAPCEIIIIDDASQDDSLLRALAFAETAPVPVRIVAREHNSGSPFMSWVEGVRVACGDLLWIAESDDLADPRLLERLAPFLERDERVVLAYCQSAVIGRHGERLADDHLFYTDEIDAERWEAPYLVSGETEIAEGLAIKNTIPNASAVLFRRRDLAQVANAIVADRYCGDWRSYALLSARGWIGYSPEPLNLTRRHDANATLEGERNALALREARDIRLSLWRRPGIPAAAVRAGLAQHQREFGLLQERHGPLAGVDTAGLDLSSEFELSASPASPI